MFFDKPLNEWPDKARTIYEVVVFLVSAAIAGILFYHFHIKIIF